MPVGSVVTFRGRFIAQAFNLRETLDDPTAHAERLALTLAGRALGSWRLDECTLYVTLEPCPMCAGAIVLGRLGRLVYGADDPKAGACRSLYRLADDPRLNHRATVVAGLLEEECGEVLKEFFRGRRLRVVREAMPRFGGVPEWLKGPVSKTGVPLRGTVGLNPTSSAVSPGAVLTDQNWVAHVGSWQPFDSALRWLAHA